MTNDERNPNVEARNAVADFDAFWESDEEPLVLREEPGRQPLYDLEERTAKFGEAVIDFTELVPLGPRTNRLVDQIIGCGTSVGANYCEADDAGSKKEFLHRIGTCKREARETKFFLRMIVRAVPHLKPQARLIWHEAKELHLIFSSIWRKSK